MSQKLNKQYETGSRKNIVSTQGGAIVEVVEHNGHKSSTSPIQFLKPEPKKQA
jgi:hypothetical protein